MLRFGFIFFQNWQQHGGSLLNGVVSAFVDARPLGSKYTRYLETLEPRRTRAKCSRFKFVLALLLFEKASDEVTSTVNRVLFPRNNLVEVASNSNEMNFV